MCECVYVEVSEHAGQMRATSCVKTGICVIVRVRVHTNWHTSYIRSAPTCMSVFIYCLTSCRWCLLYTGRCE